MEPTPSQKGLIYAHTIFDFPICRANHHYEQWQYLDKSISYQYIVNGLKYHKNKKQFKKTPGVFNSVSSILFILTSQLYVNQLKPIKNFIQRVFPNLQELVILLIEVHSSEKDMEKIKNFISSFQRLKKVTILFKKPKIVQQINFRLGRFRKNFSSLRIPFVFAMYQSKIALRYKDNSIIQKDIARLLQDAGDSFETLIGFLNPVGQNQFMNQISKLSEWHCIEILNIQTPHAPSILISLKPLQFKYLRSLTITRAALESIQGIVKLKAPHLKELYLGQNFISCFSSLGKLRFQELKVMNLRSNMARDHQAIIYGELKLLELIHLSLMKYHQFIPQNIGYFAKIYSGKFITYIKDFDMNKILKRVFKKKSLKARESKQPKQSEQLMELDD